jgi:hypothetical protein
MLDRHRAEAAPATMLRRAPGGQWLDRTARKTLHGVAIITGVRHL